MKSIFYIVCKSKLYLVLTAFMLCMGVNAAPTIYTASSKVQPITDADPNRLTENQAKLLDVFYSQPPIVQASILEMLAQAGAQHNNFPANVKGSNITSPDPGPEHTEDYNEGYRKGRFWLDESDAWWNVLNKAAAQAAVITDWILLGPNRDSCGHLRRDQYSEGVNWGSDKSFPWPWPV